MNHEFFYPYDNSKLWTKNLILLSIINFLIYASTYMLLPATSLWMMQETICGYREICLSLVAFGVGAFLPGIFNSYLIDQFKRKNVCLLSLIGMAVASYLYPYMNTPEQVMALRLVQGAWFGIATMTIGSSLVIDVTISHRRTSANVVTNKITLFAIVVGIIAGIGIMSHESFERVIQVYIASMGGAILLLLFVRIAFRAPLQSSIVSFDRFLLPRALYPATLVVVLAAIMGILFMKMFTIWFYLLLLGGIFLSFMMVRYLHVNWSEKFRIELGTLSVMTSMIIFLFIDTLIGCYAGTVMMGLGIGLCITTLYGMIIQVALHCERGTGNNTFQLFWELGIGCGIGLECMFNTQTSTLYVISLFLSALILLIYELSLQKWYKKQLENK